jgi:hypothetical protein
MGNSIWSLVVGGWWLVVGSWWLLVSNPLKSADFKNAIKKAPQLAL